MRLNARELPGRHLLSPPPRKARRARDEKARAAANKDVTVTLQSSDERMGRQKDGRMDGRTDGRTDGQTDGRTEGRTTDGWTVSDGSLLCVDILCVAGGAAHGNVCVHSMSYRATTRYRIFQLHKLLNIGKLH